MRLPATRRSVRRLEIRSDRTWRFAADHATVWAAMTDVASYRSWWPWLTRFDGTAFAAGEAWRCAVRPPLPFVLRFTVHLDVVEPGTAAAATVSGDILGTASLTVRPVDADATDVRLLSLLAPSNPFLRRVARVAGPVVRLGHDWVLDTGARQFRRRGLGTT